MPKRKSRTYMEIEEGRGAEGAAGAPERSAEWPAAIYARLSVENSKKDDHGESIEGQVDICMGYLDEHPCLRHAGTYVDNGWTGTNTRRPGFQRMLSDIYAGRVRVVVVKDFSRFSRDYIEAGNLLENVFPAYGVRLVSVADRYDSLETDGSRDSLLIPVKNLINSYYSKDISRKVSSAVHARQLAGEHIPSMIPYGYRKSETRAYRLEPDPETAANVTRIFQMRVDGVPLNRIAATLQEEGVPSPGKLRYQRGMTSDPRYGDSKWSAAMVKTILRNPTYLGNLVFGRMPTALYLGKPDYRYEPDESKWRVLEGMHEPLVTKEVFERAARMAEEGRASRAAALERTAGLREKNAPAFRGKIFCGCCGCVMTYRRDTRHPERMNGTYYCARHERGQCDSAQGVRQDRLMDIVRKTVEDQASLFRGCEEAMDGAGGGRAAGLLEECRARVKGLGIRACSARDRRERLYEDFADGIITSGEYAELKKGYDDEYGRASAELAEAEARLARLSRALSGNNEWLMHIRQFDGESRFSREMLDELVEKILIYKDGDGSLRVEVRFRYAADRDLLAEACGLAGKVGKGGDGA